MQRDGRSLVTTAAARAEAPSAANALRLLEQGARSAREAAGEAHHRLRIGAVTTAGEHLVASLLRTYREAHPELEITLHVGNRQDVFQRLVDHEVDLAITGRFPEELSVDGRPFAPNEFVLITAPGDPLAGRREVAVEELAQRTWILREPGSGTRRLCEEYLAGRDLRPELLTMGSNGAIKQAVALGLGIA